MHNKLNPYVPSVHHPAMPRFALLLAIGFAVASACASATAQGSLVGVATVTDGDSIAIHGTRIRLHGIDAPESAQTCRRPSGERWRCGQQAAFALADLLGRSTVRCEGLTRDRYGRTIARCYRGEVDANAWMVREGWAMAYRRYSDDFTAEEKDARDAGRGIWSGDVVPPWEWRRGKRLSPEPPGTGETIDPAFAG